jgi:alkanesulfonate monooxygenase SsuD/methylene tetrahydromethanopterin reductase-like flavin-dependent oxidoreductase (luciferase family)
MRETVTALRDLDGPDLHTPVVMAVRGPKAQALAAALADTVNFALMPGDDRVEITRVVRDFRATRDVELAIANTASGTHVEIAIESAYRAHGELEASDRMVDARAIAYVIPCGRPRGPAIRDQVTPSLIMINGVRCRA